MSNISQLENAKAAVVQVGGGGRGFIVGAGIDRFVVTAAHCVPSDRIPTPHLSNGASELTFPNIIGPLGGTPTICGELCVYSLTDDIAAFCEPEGGLEDEYMQYVDFTDAAAMKIGKLPDRATPPRPDLDAGQAAFNSRLEEREQDDAHTEAAFILSLDGEWQPCTVHNGGRYLTICDGADQIRGGMSGSPIIDTNGDAIGLVSTGGEDSNLNPSLDCLPAWLLRKLDRTEY